MNPQMLDHPVLRMLSIMIQSVMQGFRKGQSCFRPAIGSSFRLQSLSSIPESQTILR